MRITRIDIEGELPVIASLTPEGDDIWLSQGEDSIAMTRDQAKKVRNALNRLLEPVFDN